MMRLRVIAYATVFLVIAVLDATPPTCFGGASSTYKSLEELHQSWSPGDRIMCLLPIIGSALRLHHHMLVADEVNVIHTVGYSDGTYVKEEKYTYSASIHKECRNEGPGTYGAEAVQRARKWVSANPVYFNTLTCNCRHYVNYWVDGKRKGQCPPVEKVEGV